jgi:hypothetical protein
MTTTSNAIETLTDLIDANKEKMADYDYMRMMDCLKELFEKKDESPPAPIVREPVRDFQRETLLTVRNRRLTERFYEIFTANTRCSNCGGAGHNARTCNFNVELINFEGDEDTASFSISVLIEKRWTYYNQHKSKHILDMISMTHMGFISEVERDDIDDTYLHSELNGAFYYYNKQIIKDLLLTDVSTKEGMRVGLMTSRVNNRTKYFDK